MWEDPPIAHFNKTTKHTVPSTATGSLEAICSVPLHHTHRRCPMSYRTLTEKRFRRIWPNCVATFHFLYELTLRLPERLAYWHLSGHAASLTLAFRRKQEAASFQLDVSRALGWKIQLQSDSYAQPRVPDMALRPFKAECWGGIITVQPAATYIHRARARFGCDRD
jgi:hypothetical protein